MGLNLGPSFGAGGYADALKDILAQREMARRTAIMEQESQQRAARDAAEAKQQQVSNELLARRAELENASQIEGTPAADVPLDMAQGPGGMGPNVNVVDLQKQSAGMAPVFTDPTGAQSVNPLTRNIQGQNTIKARPLGGVPSLGVQPGLVKFKTAEEVAAAKREAIRNEAMGKSYSASPDERVIVPALGIDMQGKPKEPSLEQQLSAAGRSGDEAEIQRVLGLMRAQRDNSTRAPVAGLAGLESDADAEVLAEQLNDGTLVPAMLGKRANYNHILATASRLSREATGKPYDARKANLEFGAATRAISSLNSPQQQRFQALAVSVVNTIDEVKALASDMQNSGLTFLNRAEMEAKLKLLGNTEQSQLVAKYLGAVTTLKEEFANLISGGYAPQEASFALANKQVNENYGVKAMHASLNEVQRLINFRLQAFQMMGVNTGQILSPQGAPAPSPAPATNRIYYDINGNQLPPKK